MKIITDKLFELQDTKYREFSAKLIPNIDIDKIIGVRTPDIRKLAKEIKDEVHIDDIHLELPHKYQ